MVCRLFACVRQSTMRSTVFAASCAARLTMPAVWCAVRDTERPNRLGRAAACGDSRRGRAGKSCDDAHGKQFSVHLIRPPFLAICRKFARKSAEICGKPLEKLVFEQVLTHEQNFIEKKYHPVHSDGKFGEESGLQKFKEGI